MRGLLLLLVLLTVFAVPAAGAPAQGPSLRGLLVRHVPILVLHPAEHVRPCPVDGFLADADVQRRVGTGWETIGGPLPVGWRRPPARPAVVPRGRRPGRHRVLRLGRGRPRRAPGRLRRRVPSRHRIDLQYWLWYPWNLYSPTVPPGELWQVHEGDWESVSVILDLRGKPLVAGHSQHSEGARREWARVPKLGQRPLVYVALGSHANYFGPGTHRFDPRIVDPVLISVIEAERASRRSITRAAGRVVRPRLVRVTRDDAVVDDVRRRMGRGRLPPRASEPADRLRARPARARVPRAVAEPVARRPRAGRASKPAVAVARAGGREAAGGSSRDRNPR